MAASPTPPDTLEVFYSYAHEDEPLLGELRKHLGILKRQGVIRDWHDRRLRRGPSGRGRLTTTSRPRVSSCCWSVPISSPPTTATIKR